MAPLEDHKNRYSMQGSDSATDQQLKRNMSLHGHRNHKSPLYAPLPCHFIFFVVLMLGILTTSRWRAAWAGDDVDARGAVFKLQALGQAGAAEGVLCQELAKVHADGVLQRNVIVVRDEDVMEETECGTLQPPCFLEHPLRIPDKLASHLLDMSISLFSCHLDGNKNPKNFCI